MTDVDMLEESRLALQSRLDAAKSQFERNRLGQFATPGLLANQVIAAGLSLLEAKDSIRFLDPGFGTGSFYSALLAQVKSRRLQRAVGFEIDPHYGRESKSLWKDASLDLQLKDFTALIPPAAEAEKFNFLVCNPPYVRHHHLDRTQKELLAEAIRRATGRRLNGLSGLYCYFLLLSRAWMSRRGIGVWLIPSEFMDVKYGRQVKRFLLEDLTLLRIHRFDSLEVQFDDALVSSAVVFVRNERPPPNHQVCFTFGGSLECPQRSELVSADRLLHLPKWTGLACKPAAPTVNSTRRLADLFVIKRGLATGCNSFFVLTAEDVKRHRLPKRFLTPILPSPRYLTVNEIEADERGNPLLENIRYLLDCGLSESEIQRTSPELWAYLQSGKQAGVDQRYLCVHRNPWYSQERRAAPPFLCTYMGRTTELSRAPFRFILNHSRAIAANVYLLLYPKPFWSGELAKSAELRRDVWNRLNEIASQTLMDEGRLYGGGLHKMEPKELANVPADSFLDLLPTIRQTRQATLFEV